jgi:hypothetical protein
VRVVQVRQRESRHRHERREVGGRDGVPASASSPPPRASVRSSTVRTSPSPPCASVSHWSLREHLREELRQRVGVVVLVVEHRAPALVVRRRPAIAACARRRGRAASHRR